MNIISAHGKNYRFYSMIQKGLLCLGLVVFSLYTQEESPKQIVPDILDTAQQYLLAYPGLLQPLKTRLPLIYTYTPNEPVSYVIKKEERKNSFFQNLFNYFLNPENQYTIQVRSQLPIAPPLYTQTMAIPTTDTYTTEFHLSKNKFFPPSWITREHIDDLADQHTDGPNQLGSMLYATGDPGEGSINIYTKNGTIKHAVNNSATMQQVITYRIPRQLTCALQEDADRYIISYIEANRNNTAQRTGIAWGTPEYHENPVYLQELNRSAPAWVFFMKLSFIPYFNQVNQKTGAQRSCVLGLDNRGILWKIFIEYHCNQKQQEKSDKPQECISFIEQKGLPPILDFSCNPHNKGLITFLTRNSTDEKLWNLYLGSLVTSTYRLISSAIPQQVGNALNSMLGKHSIASLDFLTPTVSGQNLFFENRHLCQHADLFKPLMYWTNDMLFIGKGSCLLDPYNGKQFATFAFDALSPNQIASIKGKDAQQTEKT